MIDFREIEKKWQFAWETAKIFEANPDSNPERQKFFETVPYPYMSGPLHIGHGRTYTIGDVYSRFMRMRGYNVLWPMAFHITGTPVLGVASRIAEGDQAAIALYRGYVKNYIQDETEISKVLESFSNPWNVATFFSNVCKQDFQSLGFGIDWRRTFTTGDPEYNAFVRWQFGKLMAKGYIKQGNYPILYCPHDQNAVGEDDLLTGENAKIVEFTSIKFPYEDGFLVASTLRPETIYGVTNLWLNPDAVYVKAKVDGENWYVAKAALQKLTLQSHTVEALGEYKGASFVGKTCRPPLASIDRDLPILPAGFVDPDAATGVVYSVPAHAPYDYQALVDLQRDPQPALLLGVSRSLLDNIRPIAMIGIEGYSQFPAKDLCERMGVKSQQETAKLEEATQTIYRDEFYRGVLLPNTGQFAGQPVRTVKPDVLALLKANQVASTIFETDQHPVVCRCNTPVTVAVLDNQWFLDYSNSEWKKEAKKLLDTMVIFPEKYRSYFEATFDWLHERPCARRKGIGTKLPFAEKGDWIIESLSDSTIYMAFYTIIGLIRDLKIAPEQLTSAFFDYVLLGVGKRASVAKETGISAQNLEKIQAEFIYWYPNDLRHTAISHISNHLSFFIFHHAAIFPPKHQPKAITLNEHLVREGKKMSKSKGNVIPLADVPKSYSADLARLFYLSAAELEGLVDWRENQLRGVQTKLGQLWTTIETILAIPKKELPAITSPLSYTSRWLLSRVNSVMASSEQAIKSYEFRTYILEAVFTLLADVRQYLETTTAFPAEERSAVLWYTLDKWIRVLTPGVPHLAEETWHRMGHDQDKGDFVSVADWPTVDPSRIDHDMELAQNVLQNTLNDVREVLSLIQQSAKPNQIRIYIAAQWKFKALSLIKEEQTKLTMPELMRAFTREASLQAYKREAAKLAERISKIGHIPLFTSSDNERTAFEQAKNRFKLELDLEVEVFSEDEAPKDADPLGKARNAFPGKPAFYLHTTA